MKKSLLIIILTTLNFVALFGSSIISLDTTSRNVSDQQIIAETHVTGAFETQNPMADHRQSFFEKMISKAWARKMKKQMHNQQIADGTEEKQKQAGSISFYLAAGGWLLGLLASSAGSAALSILILLCMVAAIVFGIIGLGKNSNRKQRILAGLGLGLAGLFMIIFFIALGSLIG